ncbi:MAG: shikimate dehydrogenase [Bacteroidales bacterium]|nr:shikimate dehydrogenase [Bacteroidales bacterium]
MDDRLHFALIGSKLSHSWSQHWFDDQCRDRGIDDRDYALVELDSLDALRAVVAERRLRAFNVTIPYKRAILPLLDELSPESAAIGAVNVVEVRRNGDGSLRLYGRNTDAPAFLQTLSTLLQPWHRHALILGTGGAAHAVAWALERCHIGYRYVSRTPAKPDELSYSDAVALAADKERPDAPHLVVNATPVGMSGTPWQACSPWPRPDLWSPRHLCYDLIYNPGQTPFLRDAAAHGAATANGLDMLHRQALLSGFLTLMD